MTKETVQPFHAAVASVDPDLVWICEECCSLVEGPAHIVAEGSAWIILHPKCASRRYGSDDVLGAPCCGTSPLKVSVDDPVLMERGFDAWLAQFEPEPHGPSVRTPALPEAMIIPLEERGWATSPPWSWWQRGTELSVYRLKDGSVWILSQHLDGTHKLVPWPAFPQWQAWFPSHLAKTDRDLDVLIVQDVNALEQYLEPLLRRTPARGTDWPELARSELLWIL